MKSFRGVSLCMLLAIGLFMSVPGYAANGGKKVVWKRIVGIVVPGSLVGRRLDTSCDPDVGCVEGTPAAWTTTDGHAELDLDLGSVEFSVKGLVLAGDPTFDNIGTPGIVTKVKGTVVCNDTEPGPPDVVDTDATPLDASGNAKFHGRVDLPPSCANEPGDLVFLIRIVDVADPSRGFLIDEWNAFGAVRNGPDDSEKGEGY